jgi:hypothetical protein
VTAKQINPICGLAALADHNAADVQLGGSCV